MIQFMLSFFLISLTMTVVIITILLFNRLFGKAFSAKIRYTVWLVALIGVIIPLRPVIGDAVLTIRLPAQIHTPQIAGAEILFVTESGMMALESAKNSTFSLFSSPLIVCIFIWGIIAIMVFVYHIWRYARFLKTIKRWGEAVQDENILSVFRAVQTEMGLGKKKIELKICSFISSSALTGIIRPMILLPKKHFETDELELIFRHEFIHYKRRDLYVKLLSVIAASVHWFNPIVHRMNMVIQADGEASCDEAVLVNANKENRQFYAEVIVGMIGENTSRTILSTCFYGGKSGIKKRLDSILDTSQKVKRPAVFVLAGVMAMTMLSGSIIAFAIQEVSEIVNIRITSERAMEIALETVGGGGITEIKYDDVLSVHKVVVLYGDKRYSMDIRADDGLVMNYSLEAIEIVVSDNLMDLPIRKLTAEQAAQAALSIVGGGIVKEIKFERKDEMLIYKIKGRYERTKYKMRINAATGEIISFQKEETKTFAPSHSAKLTFDDAIEIALKRVGGGEILEVEFERDKGIWIYEVEVRHNFQKYAVYINANTGKIIKFK